MEADGSLLDQLMVSTGWWQLHELLSYVLAASRVSRCGKEIFETCLTVGAKHVYPKKRAGVWTISLRVF